MFQTLSYRIPIAEYKLLYRSYVSKMVQSMPGRLLIVFKWEDQMYSGFGPKLTKTFCGSAVMLGLNYPRQTATVL